MSRTEDVVRLRHMLDSARKAMEPARNCLYALRPRQGTRDRFTHGYFDGDLDVVWEIVSVDIAPLVTH